MIFNRFQIYLDIGKSYLINSESIFQSVSASVTFSKLILKQFPIGNFADSQKLTSVQKFNSVTSLCLCAFWGQNLPQHWEVCGPVLKNGFSWIFEKIPQNFLGFRIHRVRLPWNLWRFWLNLSSLYVGCAKNPRNLKNCMLWKNP